MSYEQVSIKQIPNKAVFSHREAARFLGESPRTFTKTVKAQGIPVFWHGNRKAYRIEDLEVSRSHLRKYNYTRESPDGRRKRECKKVEG